MASSLPASYDGKFTLLVQITATNGKEEELAKHLAAVSKNSGDTSKEPGTLLYRMARGFGADKNKFTIFEQFANPKALEAHRNTEAFQALHHSGTMGELKLAYYEEI
ncbi:hypothetical protein VNI00_009073 [Paramarasmius palmivorus]|uniref:ABM domain-containing protein n=1 Tax=Paramarasmius palmivorus TaxID=297713 RepID=A0AAW0CSW3_9AGAR